MISRVVSESSLCAPSCEIVQSSKPAGRLNSGGDEISSGRGSASSPGKTGATSSDSDLLTGIESGNGSCIVTSGAGPAAPPVRVAL
eukprot:12291334-Heterocapsa_arctica.AAC.1